MLTPRQHATMVALCRRLVPLAEEPDPEAVRLTRLVEVRMEGFPAPDVRRLGLLLSAMDLPLAGVLNAGSPGGFAALAPRAQERWLRRWESSRIPAFRSAFQALRRLVLSTRYADAASHAGIGYAGPLHGREPRPGWEGPLPGAATAEEPIARAIAGRPIRVIPIRPQLELLADPTLSSVVEGERIRDGTRVRAEVCVVGTGAGGAVAAARLAAAGHDVVLLEEGAYWTPESFTEREAEMTPRLYADAGVRATTDRSIPIVQGRAVGGGTLMNWLVMLRTPEWVLDEWADEHGTVGMTAGEMEPHFTRIEEETHARIVPDEAHSPGNRAILDGARALGWSAGALRVNARGCVRCGFCGLGCRWGARRGAAEVYIPAALARGARLFADVRAERVELLGGGGGAMRRVSASVLDRATGAVRGRMTVEAPIVVLAGGAVETPALLQRSALGGGGVGSWLRLHPTAPIFGAYGRPMFASSGVPLSAVCDEFLRGSDGYGFWIESSPFYPGLAAAALPGYGEDHRDAMARHPTSAGSIVLLRDGADRERSSGEVRVDRGGRPVVRYRLSGVDRARLVRGVEAAARLHFAAGALEVSTSHAPLLRLGSPADLPAIGRRPSGPNRLGILSAHVNGSCRIGTDPARSGCTPDGERHGIPGLYVADGSLLPTAPGANPQETIMAVASVVAERIAARHPAGRAGSAGALAGTR
jgi:choline dehydrogenase-like flavoprotein